MNFNRYLKTQFKHTKMDTSQNINIPYEKTFSVRNMGFQTKHVSYDQTCYWFGHSSFMILIKFCVFDNRVYCLTLHEVDYAC